MELTSFSDFDGIVRVTYTACEEDTDQLRRILVHSLPLTMDRFATKNRHYGENTFPLGAAGQFPEISRKVRLLQAQIWDKRDSAIDVETVDDVVDDLIGHLLMLKDCIAQAQARDVGAQVGDAFLEAVMSEPADDRAFEAVVSDGKDHTSHIFLVGDRDENDIFTVHSHGHSIRMAVLDQERCPWNYGDIEMAQEDMRCVGVEGHETHGETWHITRNLKDWEATS